VQLQDVSHKCVEHVETCCLLHCPSPMVDHVEDGRQYLVHALHVLHFRVQSRKNKQNSRHVVVTVSSQPFRRALLRTLLTTNQFVLLPTRACEKWHWKGLCRAGKECQFWLSAAGVFLYLLPQSVILLEGCKNLWGRGAVENHGWIFVLSWMQKLPDKLGIQLFVPLRLYWPPLALSRQIPKRDLPCIFSQERSFIGNTRGEGLLEGTYVDLGWV